MHDADDFNFKGNFTVRYALLVYREGSYSKKGKRRKKMTPLSVRQCYHLHSLMFVTASSSINSSIEKLKLGQRTIKVHSGK